MLIESDMFVVTCHYKLNFNNFNILIFVNLMNWKKIVLTYLFDLLKFNCPIPTHTVVYAMFWEIAQIVAVSQIRNIECVKVI